MLWRHGDILVAAVGEIPGPALRQQTTVIAWGEATGHRHRIEDPDTADLYEYRGVIYVRVTVEAARLVHEEHHPITLPRGLYRCWHQREYAPDKIRRVVD